MAATVIFGLMAATFLMLVVVPALYFLLERGKERITAGREVMDQKRLELYQVCWLRNDEEKQLFPFFT